MNLLRPFASVFGYDVIRKSKDILFARHLPRVLSTHGINCVLDVGANEGQYGLKLREAGYTGIIHSFEPLPDTFQILKSRSESDSSWFIHNYALGSSDATLDIHVAASSDFSSFLEPNKYCESRFGDKSSISHQHPVEVKQLDHILNDLKLTDPEINIHLKMDTQGYDLEVFKGARKSLAQVQTLQSEISIRELYEGMPDYLSALRMYRDAGFNISGMFPVTRDKRDLSVIEFDCIMVKPPR